MRLLRRKSNGSFELTTFDTDDPPPYAILSHTWSDGEVTYDELLAETGKNKAGYDKIRFCGERAVADNLQYFWIDTCCIDKANSQEFQTAINSMFRWYQRASKCYVHLSDVQISEDVTDAQTYRIVWADAFRRSRWFTRGWTLPELLAPSTVEFFSKDGKLLGSKVSLELEIYDITKIPVRALRGQQPLSTFSVPERMSWSETRQTTYKEDKVYCLLGIFDVFLPLIYGEGEEHASQRLEEEIQRRSGQKERRNKEALQDLPVSSLLPFPRNEFFVGREDQLQSLEDLLMRRDSHQRVTIVGLGGCGKSALALEFAYRLVLKEINYLVFWVPAINRQSFELAYRNIGVSLQLPGIADNNADVLSLVKKKLDSSYSRNWLMIIDNADNVNVLLSESNDDPKSRPLGSYLPHSDRGKIIFTTRSRKAAETLTQSNVIKLDDMDGTAARQLMLARLSEKALLEDEAAVEELLGLLAYLPLAIVQATAFIDSNQISIANYISLLKEPSTEARLFSKHFEDPSRYREMESTIAKTWHISFDQILKQDQLAADYLSFLACIDRVSIPQSLLPRADPLLQVEAIGTLKGYAFITERQRTPQQPKGERFFDVHRLIQMASMWWLQEHGEWTTWTNKAVARMEELVPLGEHEGREAWARYLPHAVHVAELDDALDEIAKAELLERVGRCQISLGQYSAAEKTLRQVFAYRRKNLGEEHKNTLISRNNLGIALYHGGKNKEAESIHRQTLARRETGFGLEHPDTLISMNNLALVLYDQGKYEEAESMSRQTLALKEKVFGLEHPSTLNSLDNLALALSSQGKYTEAESIHRQTLASWQKVLGPEHPDTLIGMNNLALVLDSLGRYKEAESMSRETLALKEKVLGPEHPTTLLSMHRLADNLAKQNRYAESRTLYERACAAFKEVLGEDHPRTRSCCEAYRQVLKSEEQDRLADPDIPRNGVSGQAGKRSRLSRGLTKMGIRLSKGSK